MENNIEIKKSNTQLLKEIQDTVDDIDKQKEEIEIRLKIIDVLERKQNTFDAINKEKEEVDKLLKKIEDLENKFFNLSDEIRNNSKK